MYVCFCVWYLSVQVVLCNCVLLHHTGNEKRRIFALGGQTVEDANIGQSLAHSGSVVVSPDVWRLCSHDKFFGNKIGKTNFMEVVHVSDFHQVEIQQLNT